MGAPHPLQVMEVALPRSKLKVQQHNIPKLLLPPTIDEPDMHIAMLERKRRGKMEEKGTADGMIHKKIASLTSRSV